MNKYRAHSYRWLGNSLRELGQVKEALQCYYKAYDLNEKEIDKEDILRLEKCLNPWTVIFNNIFFC